MKELFLSLDFHNKAKLVIEKFFDKEFSSHEFIEKFAEVYGKDYIYMLYCSSKDRENGIFQVVHSQIGAYLRDHSETLGIKKLGEENVSLKKDSINIFGNLSRVQVWKKL